MTKAERRETLRRLEREWCDKLNGLSTRSVDLETVAQDATEKVGVVCVAVMLPDGVKSKIAIYELPVLS
jgi:hypothetical protein